MTVMSARAEERPSAGTDPVARSIESRRSRSGRCLIVSGVFAVLAAGLLAAHDPAWAAGISTAAAVYAAVSQSMRR